MRAHRRSSKRAGAGWLLAPTNPPFTGSSRDPESCRPFTETGWAGFGDKPVIPARFAKCRLPTRADIRTFGHLGYKHHQQALVRTMKIHG